MKRILTAALVLVGAAAFADNANKAECKSPDAAAVNNIGKNFTDFLHAADIGTIHKEGEAQTGTGGSGGAGQQEETNLQYMDKSWQQLKGQSNEAAQDVKQKEQQQERKIEQGTGGSGDEAKEEMKESGEKAQKKTEKAAKETKKSTRKAGSEVKEESTEVKQEMKDTTDTGGTTDTSKTTKSTKTTTKKQQSGHMGSEKGPDADEIPH